jgi:hypothetical protein
VEAALTAAARGAVPEPVHTGAVHTGTGEGKRDTPS